MTEPLSAASAGAASTAFGSSAAAGEEDAAEVDVAAAESVAKDPVGGVEAVTAAPELTASTGGAEVVWTAAGAAMFGNTAAAAGDETGIGAATFAAGVIAGRVRDSAREDTAELSGLPLGGAAAIEADDDAGFAGKVTVVGAVVVAEVTGARDGTAAARTLVTIARAATGAPSGSFGRSIRESTTPAPAVAPIAVATKTTRAVRAKLGAGAK